MQITGNNFQTNLEVGDLPFVVAKKVLSSEPSENWDEVDYIASARASSTATNTNPEQIRKEIGGSFTASMRQTLLGNSIRNSIHKLGIDLLQHTEKPSHVRRLYDTELNLVSTEFLCSVTLIGCSISQERYSSCLPQILPVRYIIF